MAPKVDETDRKLLELLRENGRLTNRELGKKVGLSEPAARRRVANLIGSGVIKRFTVDTEEVGGVAALVFIATAAAAPSERIVHKLRQEHGVSAVWEISGEMDFAVALSSPDMEQLNRRIDSLRKIAGVRKTRTSIILKRWK